MQSSVVVVGTCARGLMCIQGHHVFNQPNLTDAHVTLLITNSLCSCACHFPLPVSEAYRRHQIPTLPLPMTMA